MTAEPGVFYPESKLLRLVGERVREARARRGMTRKILARDSGVSERYIAQLESGQGNPSVLVMFEIAQALDLPIEKLVYNAPELPLDLLHLTEYLKTMPPDALAQVRNLIIAHFGGIDPLSRNRRVALIGLRGAGKSTLGAILAERLNVPFFELDRLIEQESGVSLSVIFDLYGQSGFRRFERRCLEDVIDRYPGFVLATGGSLVSEPATFERLLTTCYTVWLRASADDHMQRVVAQGDTRPMADNRESMADLERILAVREPLYSQADLTVDTSVNSLEKSTETIKKALKNAVRKPVDGSAVQK